MRCEVRSHMMMACATCTAASLHTYYGPERAHGRYMIVTGSEGDGRATLVRCLVSLVSLVRQVSS
jgi:hypothetical protein